MEERLLAMSNKTIRIIYRDAKTGRIITKEDAERNPDTSVRETIQIEKNKKQSPKKKKKK